MADFMAINQEMSTISDPELAAVAGTQPEKITERSANVLKSSVRKFAHLRGLFTNKLAAWSYAALFMAYITQYFAFNLAGGFLPLILERRGAAADQSIVETYQQYCMYAQQSTLCTMHSSYYI